MARKISVIIPSFNDERILRAIQSVRAFDDGGYVGLVIVDGGSRSDLVRQISSVLTTADLLVSESDRGIFDAINKGLALCRGEIIGWIGSDDLYTGKLRASEVVSLLADGDLLVTNSAHFRKGYVTRVTYGLPTRLGLAKFGLSTPHFGTFGRTALFCSRRFNLSDPSADIEYFLSILQSKPKVVFARRLAVLAEEGGFSTLSPKRILRLNIRLVRVYARYVGPLAPLSVLVKLAYKSLSAVYYRVRKRPASSLVTFDASL